MSTPTILAAGLTLGLLNAAHCAAMCGPFALRVVGWGESDKAPLRGRSGASARMASYLFGKTFTYVFLGAVAGHLGGALASVVESGRDVLSIAVGVGLLAAGASLLIGKTRPSRLGAAWTAWLGPMLSRFAPGASAGRAPGGAAALGMLTGLLPCGVTAMAVLAASAQGGAPQGALFMFAFGLGTGPVLSLIGLFGRGALIRARPALIRVCGGVLIMLAGVVSLARVGMSMHGHHMAG